MSPRTLENGDAAEVLRSPRRHGRSSAGARAGSDSPHYQVRLSDGGRRELSAAVNVLSQESPSELLYLVVDDLQPPDHRRIGGLAGRLARAAAQPAAASTSSAATSFDRAAMRSLPPDVAGPDNDLADLLDHYVQRAIADPDARVYAFGERWGPETVRDKIFGFKPGNGVHDIHMNQGNSARFRGDDGVWQDGGLLHALPGASRWVGIFLAFQSQAWHTDDTHRPRDRRRPADARRRRRREPVRGRAILAAMVNPDGGSPERETVLLLNASPQRGRPQRLAARRPHEADCAVPAGAARRRRRAQRACCATNVQLGNKGGSITLLDKAGPEGRRRRVHGRAGQARGLDRHVLGA